MGASQTAAQLRELSVQLRSCQERLLGSFGAEMGLIEKRRRAERTAKRDRLEAERRAIAARRRCSASLAKGRVKEIVDDLIGEHDIGPLKVAEYLQIGSIYLPTSGAPEHTVPLIVPFLGHGNLAFRALSSEAVVQRDAAVRLVEARALERTAPRQLDIVSYDPLLSNLESPFASTAQEGGVSVKYIQSPRDLDDYLDELIARTTRIYSSHLVEECSIVDRCRSLGMPLDPYALVVFHNYPQQISEAQHRRIVALAGSAPAAGVSFIFCLSGQGEKPKWFNPLEFGETEILSVDSSGHTTWEGHEEWSIELYGIEAHEAADMARRLGMQAAALPELSIDSLLPEHHFQSTSEDGFSFPIGMEEGKQVEVTMGSSSAQRHNALVTGAVGQGKSNLIKVIIYGLCARYSPDELSLYLLDFKEGVTLYPMAPTKESPEYLPQARVLGLEADQDFGIEVLRFLVGEMARRAMDIRPFGDSLLAYRRESGRVMPRILLVVDEFQLLLEGSRGSEARALLERIVRQGRSSGIHVILASQSIGGISSLLGSGSQFFAQFPIRVGLKNSPEESRATFGQLNDSAAHLRFRGQAILNENYGDPASNRTVLIARADDGRLADLRDILYREVGTSRKAPVVFDGSKLPSLGLDLRSSVADRRGSVPFALLGRSMKVDQKPTLFPFEDLPGRNIAIIGRGFSPEFEGTQNLEDLGRGVFEAALISLCLSSDDSIPFVLLDFGFANQAEKAGVLRILESCSREVERVERKDFGAWIASMTKELDEGAVQRRWVIGPSMDRAGSLDFSAQGQLQRVLREGASWGAHFLFRWAGTTVLQSQLGMGGLAAFEGCVFLFGSQAAARQIVGPTCDWNGQSRRALYLDSASGGNAEKLIPYASPSSREVTRLLEGSHGRA